MMKEHRYSNEIKSIRLQTLLYDSVSQSATPSRMAHNSTTYSLSCISVLHLLMTFHINFFK